MSWDDYDQHEEDIIEEVVGCAWIAHGLLGHGNNSSYDDDDDFYGDDFQRMLAESGMAEKRKQKRESRLHKYLQAKKKELRMYLKGKKVYYGNRLYIFWMNRYVRRGKALKFFSSVKKSCCRVRDALLDR